MLNIIDLEARWLRYKIKSYLPHFIFFAASLSIAALIFLYISTEQSSQTQEPQMQEVQNTLPEVAPIQVIQEVLLEEKAIVENEKPSESPSTPDKEEKIEEEEVEEKIPDRSRVFTPSMDFMQELGHNSKPYYDNQNIAPSTTPSSVQIEQTFEEEHLQEVLFDTDEEYTQANEPQKDEQIQSKKVNIKRQNIEEDLVGIIARFKKSNNPALSLFIAKKYYELGDYHNAYNYALITNNLNRDIETSWIIFSKSLVKLGKGNMAIKTLKEYLSYSKSKSAKILLDEIESGKFK